MNRSRRAFLKSSTGVAGAVAVGIGFAEEPAAAKRTASPVAGVRELGSQFLVNSVGVTGADGAASTVLPGGEALWVFGDTVEGPFDSIRGLDLTPLRSNTGAIVPRQDAANGIREFRFVATGDGKRPRQLVAFAADEDPARNRVWAIHGACVGQHVYLYYHRISLLDGVDVFENFRLDGMGLARAEVKELAFTRLAAPDGTKLFWKGDQPTYGVFVEATPEFLYLWGSLITGMFLARVPPAAIEDLAAYEYLVEAPTLARPGVPPRWSRTYAPTAVLFDNVPNEMSAAYNAHLQKHVAIHALGRENKIVMRTAPERTGPWSAPVVVHEPPLAGKADMIYAAKEHPELAADGGRRLYVTYVNSATYVPQLLEVTLR